MPEDLRWLRPAANDLNNLLQVIAESARSLETLCESEPNARQHYTFIRDGLRRATTVASDLVEKLGGLQDAAAAPVPPAAAPGSAPQGELILIIDDEEMLARLVSQMLIEAGYRAVAATDPIRAVASFREHHAEVALVILDFTMPVMDGAEVFEELRKIRPDAAVMLSSGFAEQDKVRAMLARGLRGFLPKPYTRDKLITHVQTTLAAVRSQRTGERRVM